MTMPTFQALGTEVVSNTTTITVAWPAHAIDDVALLLVESQDDPITLTTAAGFVEVTTQAGITSAAHTNESTRLAVYWCRATSAAMTSPVVAGIAGTGHVAGIIITFRGCLATGNPWNAITAITTTGVGAQTNTPSIPGLTTTVADCLVFAMATDGSDSPTDRFSNWANSSLSSVTERMNWCVSTGDGGGMGGICGGMATAGTVSATSADSLTINHHAYFCIAFEPVPSGPGTTELAILEGEGIRIGFVMAIEGYNKLITDAALVAPVINAWIGTGWTAAITGLEVRGQIKQSIEPWADTIDAPRLTFVIQPDEDDTFGIAVWKSKPTFSTYLNGVFQPAADASGVMTVHQTVAAASSGTMYIGGKQVTYSGKSGTTFTVSDANTNSPFPGAAAARYATAHPLPETGPLVRVQDVPKTWIGKRVALYLHRIRGGIWDSKTNALLEFAGRIKSLSEDDDGKTVIECEDLRADIRDAVLLQNQWRGKVREGIRLRAGVSLKVGYSNTGGSSSTQFDVVASGAAGTAQCNAGYYDVYEFVSLLDKWLAGIALTGDWSIGIEPEEDGGGLRTRLASAVGAGPLAHQIALYSTASYVLEFLGWPHESQESAKGVFFVRGEQRDGSSTDATIVSPSPPYRFKAMQYRNASTADVSDGWVIDLVHHEGVWWEHSSYMPSPFNGWSNGEDRSFLRIGKVLAWGRFDSDTRLTNVRHAGGVAIVGAGEAGSPYEEGLTVEDPGDELEVLQVVAIAGAFSEIMPRLFASVNGAGTNHATYDVFPFGAGIPYDLLGADFLASVTSLEQSSRSQGMMLFLDKPKKLIDVLLPELAMRFAWIIFKDGCYQIVSPPTPSAIDPDHELTEANKAQADGNPARSRSEVMDEYLRNVIKVEYNRKLDGDYQDSLTIKDQASIADYGESQAVTIKAANSYDSNAATGASVEALVVSLTSRVLPALGKPCKLITRSIAPSLYHATPGDTCTLSDDFVRDPQTGTRGISARAGIILSVVHDWGHEGGDLFGEVTILISDEDRTYPLSPCAQVDHTYTSGAYTAGYDNTNFKLKLVAKQHQRSLPSTLANDIASFADGDLIRITQIDPADPTSITAWNRVVAASGIDATNNILTMTAALSSPAFNTALRYRVVSQLYSVVQASQKLHAFIADDGDRLIEDLAQPNLYGDGNQGTYAKNNYTTLPSLIPTEVYAEGRPVHPGLIADLAGMLNNLVAYKTAGQMPMLLDTVITESATSYTLTWTFPFFVGSHQQPGTVRYIKVAPRTTVNAAGGTTYVRVTSSRSAPRGSTLTGHTWDGPKNQVEFTNNADPTASGIESTVQNLRPATGGMPGMTWISVELKASGGYTAHFFGLTTLYLGPIEVG